MALKPLFLLQNCKNHPAAGTPAPSVTRLSCNGLFSTGPKLDNFCAKKHLLLVQAPSLLAKPWLRLRSRFTSSCASLLQTNFSSDYTCRIQNQLINAAGLICLFFKDEYKIVALKYQFLCAKVQSIIWCPPPPPISS